MKPKIIEQPAAGSTSTGELWRIHLDLDVDPSLTTDGRPGFHTCDGVSREDAEGALADFQTQHTDGIGFTDLARSRRWYYPWREVLDLRIMPMREAL